MRVQRMIIGETMEIAKFPSYQQAFIEMKEILAMTRENGQFVTLPQITKADDGWYVVSIVIKKRKKLDTTA